MAPLADADVQRELAVLADLLTATRKDRGDLPQHKLASLLGVSTNSVIDWESGQESLTVRHLIAWARALILRLVIVDAAGVQLQSPLSQNRGETWEAYELRKLTAVLREVRRGRPRLSQVEVAKRAGVSRTSLRHWEGLTTPPRTLGLIRWAMALDCRLRLAQGNPRMSFSQY